MNCAFSMRGVAGVQLPAFSFELCVVRHSRNQIRKYTFPRVAPSNSFGGVFGRNQEHSRAKTPPNEFEGATRGRWNRSRQLMAERLRSVFVFVACLVAGLACGAEDWPTYRHDNQRSGITSERLDLPLDEVWRYRAAHAPRPAWPAPAKADLWHHIDSINPMVTYDRAFHVAVAGDTLYFGSSADDKVYALDCATGEQRWSFFTGGPVRLAPAVWNGKLFAGSDDGRVYCLDAAAGRLIWDYAAFPDRRVLPGNGRMISACPVRTGVLVDDGTAHFCTGLFPNEGVRLCALNAEDGSELWIATPQDVSPQGYLLASATRLYAPKGRVPPTVFDRADGHLIRSFAGGGGTFALLTGDALVYGPGAAGELRMFKPNVQDRIATFDGNHIIATETASYLQASDKLKALDRAQYLELEKQKDELWRHRRKLEHRLGKLGQDAGGEQADGLKSELLAFKEALKKVASAMAHCNLWQRECAHRHALILAGDVLFAGGDGEVAAYRAADGEVLWTGQVEGRAYGLAVANGRLFVSTDEGAIHCLKDADGNSVRIVGHPSVESTALQGEREGSFASLAQRILGETGITKGYCLVLGCGEGRLAGEIAERTDLKIVAIDADPERVLAARRDLDVRGLYGVRAAVHLWRGSQARLPYVDYFANLIVCAPGFISGRLALPADEVYRVLRPCGGIAYIGPFDERRTLERWIKRASDTTWEIVEEEGLWAVAKRGPLPGSGHWTHMYADETNSACSYDERLRGPMRLQWFGRPGPRLMVDRHHQNVAPVYAHGRIFIPGDNRIMAVDAYNGAMLWNVEIPNSRRMAAPQDSCNMVATEDGFLYIAVEEACRVLDGATGREVRSFETPQLVEGQRRHWGYTSVKGELLLGSGRKPEAIYNEISWAADDYQWTEFKRMVTSDYLFCLDRHTGDVVWTYKDGVIINSAIAGGGGRIYFVESRNPAAAEKADGKAKLAVLFESDADIVALDSKTGETVWRRQCDLSAFEQVIFLSYRNETLLASGSRNVGDSLRHVLYAFDAGNGELRWRQEQDTGWDMGGRHGEQQRHPAIVGNTIYAEPFAYDLQTGEQKPDWKLIRGGAGCGTYTASASALFFRSDNPQMYDIAQDQRIWLNHVTRPGCWINIIPAGGLVLIPESSSGCTCAFPLQTSVAYAPN